MYEKNDGCSDAALLLLSLPVIFIVNMAASGYALSVLWGWFIVPTFGAPPLSIPVAFGISMLVGFMTYQEVKSESIKDKTALVIFIEALFKAILRPAFALLFGWIVQLFI